MARIPSYDLERLNHINFITNSIYDDVSEIYEGLVDREFDEVLVYSDQIIEKLEALKKSIKS